ncbi:MAG: hypothetical protein ACM33T_13175 [Solirubrobacterales bacterium]
MIITVVSKHDFDSYAPSRSAAVLRIYDPVEDWAGDADRLAQAGWGDTLSLSFWDVGVQGMRPTEAVLARLLGRWRDLCVSLGNRLFSQHDIPWRPFLSADATDIARFADALPSKGIRHVMVVCGNGRTRSWTVAQFLSRRLGAALTDCRGWQRESDAIADVLSRVSPPGRPVPVSVARFEPAE